MALGGALSAGSILSQGGVFGSTNTGGLFGGFGGGTSPYTIGGGFGGFL